MGSAAAALARLPDARAARARGLLIDSSALTSPVGSSISTPLLGPQQFHRQPPPSSAERPPRTPCPPRMAVPNSSGGIRPSSSAGGGGTVAPVFVSAGKPVMGGCV